MRGRRGGERVEVVAALQHGDQPAAAMLAPRSRRARSVIQAKSAVSSRSWASGSALCASNPAETISSSGAKAVQRRQQPAPTRRRGTRRRWTPGGSGALTTLSATPRSDCGAGAGIAGRLVGGGVEQVGIGDEDRLRAVAVVHVEIDHRDAPQPPARLRVAGGDGGVVEQAEAHRPAPARRGGPAAGRRRRRARAQPSITASTAGTRPPAARSAASALPWLITVSASSWHALAPAAGGWPGSRRRSRAGCTRASCSTVAARRLLAQQGGEFLGLQRLQDGAQPVRRTRGGTGPGRAPGRPDG